ncbi:primase alpha helix C-terminal domain-containing protein [Bacillus sp. ISL-75]|uniref:primase alpha helix C-terminal domain-containing protein n=1 Tax=Bacillus sp. ISL-75 TaxID=2819137 RepID=UPI00203619B5|nr:primase alpha helix C-terminal domain-containing protein [Bacillus sp. ISL-75]
MILTPIKEQPTAKSPSYWLNLFNNTSRGSRNNAAASLAGYLLKKYVDPRLVVEMLHLWNEFKVMPPLTDKELNKIINSIAGKEVDRRKGGNMDNLRALEEMQSGSNEQEEKKTQSQILVGLSSNMVLFYDEQDATYAKVKVNNHYEVWPIHSKGFKNILTYRYLNLSKEKDKVPGNQALQDALRALEAKARLEGQKEKVHLRIAEIEDSIYLDLCNENWQVVEINKKGWKVIDESPVYFKRSKTMQSLPTPKPNGNIENLKRFINYQSHDDYNLIIAWLLSTFKENSPFPILTIQGEQGSAKSTTTKILRALVDPYILELRALPKDERDLSIAANSTWVWHLTI